MNVNEKTLVRQLFQNKILKSDGQSFEDMFIDIMNYAEKQFQAIKPWGNIVVNDKYKGVNADCEQTIQKIKDEHRLIEAKFLTAKDIENILFTLEDDQIFSIIGFIPDPLSIKQVDFSILSEVIGYIMKLPLKRNSEYDVVLPDWEEKVLFNNLSIPVANLLNNGYLQVSFLEEYLANNSDFLADTLRDKVNEVYSEERESHVGDELFWSIVDRLSPRTEQIYQITVIVIMAKYFETCDIFEDPSLEGEKW